MSRIIRALNKDNKLIKTKDNYLVSANPIGNQKKDICGSFALDKFGAVYENFAGETCWQQ